MKKLRIIRIVLAAIFFVATVLYFVFGEESHPVLRHAARLQIIPLYLSETAGVVLVWGLITLVWGRIYCSTVCPVGTLQDIVIRVRRRVPTLNRPFRYKRGRRIRHHILVVYVVCLVIGLGVVPLVVEPWFMFGNITSLFGTSHAARLWAGYSFGALAGMLAGIVSALVILPYALLRGRDFCNDICPLGTAMGYLASRSAFQIVINPDKCTGCMECEYGCKASCIKVVSRYVDNSRCVRCFDCVARCPEKAISYTQDRHRPSTPLFARRKRQGV